MRNNIPVIYYHSVAPSRSTTWSRSWLTLELRFFEAHLKYFKENNYKTLLLDEYFDLKRDGFGRGKYLVLTFDDGYADNYIYAFPLLKKYGFKGTIFVNPSLVDAKAGRRKSLLDYWNNRVSLKEIEQWGFLTWDEMREMERAGVVDIQSHTLTHTKYFVSDVLVGFHRPGADSLYTIGNRFPERRPYYMSDPNFHRLIPYGYPLFQEASSVIAKRVTINADFDHAIVKSLSSVDWSKPYDFSDLYRRIEPLYSEYKKNDAIVATTETQDEFEERVHEEVEMSKQNIEKALNKSVYFLCWPHGDNNGFVHSVALEAGYEATTLGKMPVEFLDSSRFDRMGLGQLGNSVFLTTLKTKYKMESHRKVQPYYGARRAYELLKGRA